MAFLVDRYAFWQGDSSAIMAIVDFIVRVSPDTPIAPQILTRKARVRKNDGDLQGKIDWFCIAGCASESLL